MASGSGSEDPAVADRLREKYAKHQRSTERAIREEGGNRDLPAYRESDSEITASRQQLHMKGIPRWGMGFLAFAMGLLVIAYAASLLLRR